MAAPVNGRRLELNLIISTHKITYLVDNHPVREPIVRARKKFEKSDLLKVENMFPAGWPSFSAKAQKFKSVRLLPLIPLLQYRELR